jgi:hypothetical protein
MSGGAMNILHAIDESREEKERTFSYCAMGWLERWFRFKGVIDNMGGEVEETEGDHRSRTLGHETESPALATHTS